VVASSKATVLFFRVVLAESESTGFEAETREDAMQFELSLQKRL